MLFLLGCQPFGADLFQGLDVGPPCPLDGGADDCHVLSFAFYGHLSVFAGFDFFLVKFIGCLAAQFFAMLGV